MAFDRLRHPVPTLGVLLALLACPSVGNALTLEVDQNGFGSSAPCPEPRDSQQYPNIRSAIECAQEGDEILIGSNFFGAWRGPDNRDLVIDKSLTLRGEDFPERTTLDAQQRGRHVLVTDPNVHLTLDNIDFRNGLIESRVENSSAVGGSIRFEGNALDVIDCGFYNNGASYSPEVDNELDLPGAFGGAIAASHGLPDDPRGGKIHIRDSTFSGNSVYSISPRRSGAAVTVQNYSGAPEDFNIALEISGSAFFNNLVLGQQPASGTIVDASDWDFPSAKVVITNSFISSHSTGTDPVAGADTHLSYSSLAMYGSSYQYIGQIGGIGLTSIGTLFLALGTRDACFVHDVGGISLGHNLDSDGSCGLDAATDLPNVPVAHAVLRTAANGMPYIDLEPQSPAIDAGAVGCVDTFGRPVLFDQLGNARPANSACDIGAFESPFAGQENADPAFALDNYVASVYSDAGAGTLIETVAATDPDAGDVLDFSIVAGNTGDTFAVDATGAITVANPTLLIAGADFTLSLDVSDGRGGSDSATMQIEVVQANAAPVFSQESYSSQVDSDAAAGTLVATVAASDPDAGDPLDFSIVAGNTGDTFAINATGAVTVANPALLTAGSDFILSLEVSDGRGGSDSATMQIEVVQANQPPSFIQSSYAFEIDRNAVVGTLVGSISGTDPEGDTPTYAIVDGNAEGLFEIDALTGAITVASSIAAADALHSLQIEVEDPQGLSGSATVNITIVDEPPPQPDAIFSHGFEP